MNILQGIGVGNRTVVGETIHFLPRIKLPGKKKSNKSAQEEQLRFQKSFTEFISSLQMKAKVADENLSNILLAQEALAGDPELIENVKTEINNGWDAESAIQIAMGEFIELLKGAGGEFGERVADLEDIQYQIIVRLLDKAEEFSLPVSGKFIVIAEDLSPLETSQFTSAVVGVVTEKGGPTSHTAIVCRQLGISALVACLGATKLPYGVSAILDPNIGEIKIGTQTTESTEVLPWATRKKNIQPGCGVYGNVGSVSDALKLREMGANGVGLLRTELFFLSKTSMPSFEEQLEIYQKVISTSPSGELVIRTMDAGSDKPIAFLNLENEENPALGVRGQRLSKTFPEFFNQQLEAIFQAGEKESRIQDLSVMAPMVATFEEAKQFADSARSIGFKNVGVMLEIPAFVEAIEDISKVVEFISIGTNDLSQYLFAADRQNSGVAQLLSPWQPANIKFLREIISRCKKVNLKVGVCGDAGSDPYFSILLAGMGASYVSSAVGAYRDVLESVSSYSLKESELLFNNFMNFKLHEGKKGFISL